MGKRLINCLIFENFAYNSSSWIYSIDKVTYFFRVGPMHKVKRKITF